MKPKKKITPWLFSTPALLTFAFIVVFPIVWTVILSFQDWQGITKPVFIGLNNYRKMFNDRTFIKAVRNNFRFILISGGYQITFSIVMAVILDSVNKGKNILKVMYFVPCIISTVAISQIFIKFLALQPKGIINIVLEALGFKAKSWLGSPATSLTTLALVDGYKYCGIYMIIIYSGLKSVNQDIVDAAYIDGCSWFQSYIFVKLPMIKSVFGAVLVMLISGTIKAFEMPYVLTNGGPGTSSEMVATYMYKTAFNTMRYGYSSAMAVFLMIECLTAVLIVRRITSKSNVE